MIVVDTREQRPWTFSLPTVVAGLPVADYSLVGFETSVAIERKSLPDFVGSVTWGRTRFWRELEKLASYAFRAVVVEADVGDALRGLYPSKAHPWAILTSALAIGVDFDIPVLWLHDAETAARCAEWMLRRWFEHATAGDLSIASRSPQPRETKQVTPDHMASRRSVAGGQR
ncbi:MAG TPA: ERCC4 domain-containing protein [Polyangiaceae bacterium]|nr:ERCC4 domain-containing protein [Polyangiaceae bacterium]